MYEDKKELEIEFAADKIPEGGFNGWLAVLACFLIHVSTIGLLTTFGIYQQAYLADDNAFKGERSILAVSFIGSIANAGVGGMAIPAGYMGRRFGYRTMTLISGVLVGGSFVLGSYADSYKTRVLTQGLMFALSYPLAYFPSMSLISQYFKTKRGLAIGLATSGAGFGGLFLAPLTRYGITNYGIMATMKFIGIGCGLVVAFAGLLMRPRDGYLPPAATKSTLKALQEQSRNPYFTRFFFIPLFVGFAYFVPFGFLPSYAVDNGLTSYEGAVIIGLMNGANSLGRCILGLYGDYLGHINTLLISCILASLSVLWLWPFVTTFTNLSIFGLSYGFWIGGYFSLLTPTLINVLGDKDVASTTSTIYTGLFLGHLLGTPIVGVLLDRFGGDYLVAMLFTGGFILLGTLSLVSIKLSMGNKFFSVI
jgi:MFS family permease